MTEPELRRPRYAEYRESHVAWLGGIPTHWALSRLRDVAKLTNGFPFDSELFDRSVGVPLVRIRDIDSIETEVRWLGEQVPASMIRDGDVLVGMDGDFNVAWWRGGDALLNQRVCALRTGANFDQRYLFYCLPFPLNALNAVTYATTVKHLSSLDLLKFNIPIPPIEEQQAIAAFLDRETSRIDTLIEKKRQLLERLEEQRTALISRTVTRGLPPEAARAAGLDPAPRLKPSGVEWLGDVPEHWEVVALKWETPVTRGASPRPIDDEVYFDDHGTHAWVRISDVTAAGMYLEKTEQRLSPLGVSLSVPLEPGALFLSIAGSVGKPCITRIPCCIHDGFVCFSRWNGDVEFIYYIFASGEPYKRLGKLGTQLNLNTDTVGAIKIGIPPVPEQRAITAFLTEELSRIDLTSAATTTAIERLEEHRTALITSAVTGKIDVRESGTTVQRAE